MRPLLRTQHCKLHGDRTYAKLLLPLLSLPKSRSHLPCAWGIFPPCLSAHVLSGAALRYGLPSLPLSPFPFLQRTGYGVSIETGPGRLCQEARARTALEGAREIGIESKEQEVSSSYSQKGRRPVESETYTAGRVWRASGKGARDVTV